MGKRLKHFTDTAANWASNNPVLLVGEFGIESDSLKIKIGDGATAWNSLDYAAGGGVYDDLTDYISGTAGENLSKYDLCYQKSDGKYWKANATDDTKMPALVLAPAAMTADDNGDFIRRGTVTNAGWSWTFGGTAAFVYAAASNGAMTQTIVSGSGNQVQIVGVAIAATVLDFAPQLVLVEVA